jgi:CBS domain-containing protein
MVDPVPEVPTPPFHDIGKLFAVRRSEPVSIQTSSTVAEALAIMLEHKYSQLPVLDGDRPIGVFSLWSLARLLAGGSSKNVLSQEVEDLVDRIPNVDLETSLYDAVGYLDRHEAVLIGDQERLLAIATTWDVLSYFFEVARPFVLVQEIELALRQIIRACAGSEEESASCIERALGYQIANGMRKSLPTQLEDLSFDDYSILIKHRDNWPLFEGKIGRKPDLVSTRLIAIRDVRNKIFHFRGDVTIGEYDSLAATRDWLLEKLGYLGDLGGHDDTT